MSQDRYSKTTRNIRIGVQPVFLEAQSEPAQGRYVWAYHVEIVNEGAETVQLLNRTWHITNARGETRTVQGPGVVGEQPVLEAGARFTYSSGTPLATPSGFMVGSYEMVTAGGEHFEAAIPAFSLDSPFAPKSIN